MLCRRAISSDLAALARLYVFLNPADPVLSPDDPAVLDLWDTILADHRLRYFVAEIDGLVVGTCAFTLIPNLTRGMRPYAVIENVVTDPSFRQRGFGTALLQHALAEAWSEGCYKVMLSTGSKRESTLHFYEQAGFQRGIKTGFVAYPPKA
ncbi:MAG: GNAT family N-acetyltransferase [Verrucomicrobia bacterium]|nr:GNAT family N-acetyltransferase [Verrucomicrobiota bacterium]